MGKKAFLPVRKYKAYGIYLAWVILMAMAPPVFPAVSFPAVPAQAGPVIAIVRNKGIPAYDLALEGFSEVMAGKKPGARLVLYDQDDKQLIPRIKSQRPDLILTVGTPATLLISKEIKDIPILFTMVMDPAGNHIDTTAVVGVTLDIPAKIQLTTLQTVVPHVKRIGVLYNPPENEAVVRKAQKAAEELGLQLIAYPVRREKEIPGVTDLDLDLLWIIPDTMICQPVILRNILLTSFKRGLPVMGYTRSYAANSGALLALTCDYKDLGRQSAELALERLKSKSEPGPVIVEPRKIRLYLNQTVANRFGIPLSAAILAQASEVF